MADLGAIASNRVLHRVRSLAVWAASNARVGGNCNFSFRVPKETYAESPSKGFAGTVKNDGTAVAGATVRLYHRGTGELLAQTTSGTGGVFTFSGLAAIADYYILAFDADQNLIGYDWLTPQ